MKKWKLNLITLMHMVCEQKRENDALRSAVSDLTEQNRKIRLASELQKRKLYAEIDNLQGEVDYYKQKSTERQMVATDEIESMIKFYANGGVDA